MVRMMVGNIQDALDFKGAIKVDQYSMPSQLSGMVDEGYIDFDVGEDLQGKVDYMVIDGTLPLEPTRNAEPWMNMLQIMSNTGLHREYQVGKIAEEAIRALGVSDLDQFRISEEERAEGPTPSQELAIMEKMRGATVQPNEQVQSEVAKGNLVPMRGQAA